MGGRGARSRRAPSRVGGAVRRHGRRRAASAGRQGAWRLVGKSGAIMNYGCGGRRLRGLQGPHPGAAARTPARKRGAGPRKGADGGDARRTSRAGTAIGRASARLKVLGCMGSRFLEPGKAPQDGRRPAGARQLPPAMHGRPEKRPPVAEKAGVGTYRSSRRQRAAAGGGRRRARNGRARQASWLLHYLDKDPPVREAAPAKPSTGAEFWE